MNVQAPFDGLVIVDKPVGPSSMDVVRCVRRAASRTFNRKVKTGHAGTLDPLASGVVICCLGKATKHVDRLMGLPKVYEAEVDLSAFTTTDDREGEREEVAVAAPPARDAIDCALAGFIGDIAQTPPVFSAVHVDGHRAYKLARRGETVELASRTVRIDAIDVLGYAWPTLSLRIACGKGTYIRSLARDVGRVLGTGGHLAALRRTAVGPYTVERAFPLARYDEPLDPADVTAVDCG